MRFAFRQLLGCWLTAFVLVTVSVHSEDRPIQPVRTNGTWEPNSSVFGERMPTESTSSPTSLPDRYPTTNLNAGYVDGRPTNPGDDLGAYDEPNGGDLARGMTVFLGYDAWRGISDGSWENNGIHAGLNLGSRLGSFSDETGIGIQAGGSIGVYDWTGTDYRWSRLDKAQTQGLFTFGFFRKPDADSRWSAAIVQDWMLNSTYSVFAQSPTLNQWRAQLGYAVSEWNEIGIWGSFRGNGDTQFVNGFGTVTWRPQRQLNPYWHYKWGPSAADTWIWIGVPERDRLTGAGSLGDYTAGALANYPLSDRFGLYSLVTYMHPSASPGPVGSREEAWNFYIGVTFYPGRNARVPSLLERNWLPQLPVANNGTFLVDASDTY